MKIFASVCVFFLCLYATLATADAKPQRRIALTSYFMVEEVGQGRPESTTVTLPAPRTDYLVNGFRLLNVRLAAGATARLESLQCNIVVVADIKKRGEDTWNRIQIVGPLSRRVARTSVASTDVAASGARLLFVRDDVIDSAHLLHEGDNVAVLFAFDITRDSVYIKDLRERENQERPILTLDLQELPIVPSGDAREIYAARDGDTLRLRFLVAQYDPRGKEYAQTIREMSDTTREVFEKVAEKASERRMKGGKAIGADSLMIGAQAALGKPKTSLSDQQKELIGEIARHPAIMTTWRYADVVTSVNSTDFPLKQFGTKFDVTAVILYGTPTGAGRNRDNLNPIKTNPSFGSNVYLTYDGRVRWKDLVNWFPGVQLSLLNIGDPDGTKFTLGICHPIYPKFRHWFGVFLGWHDLNRPVMGLTFSPSLDFRKLVNAEGKQDSGSSPQ